METGTRKKINDNMSVLSNNVKDSLKDIDYSYTINYGYNYFPEKFFGSLEFRVCKANLRCLAAKLNSNRHAYMPIFEKKEHASPYTAKH